jgi:hypothetical protein
MTSSSIATSVQGECVGCGDFGVDVDGANKFGNGAIDLEACVPAITAARERDDRWVVVTRASRGLQDEGEGDGAELLTSILRGWTSAGCGGMLNCCSRGSGKTRVLSSSVTSRAATFNGREQAPLFFFVNTGSTSTFEMDAPWNMTLNFGCREVARDAWFKLVMGTLGLASEELLIGAKLTF